MIASRLLWHISISLLLTQLNEFSNAADTGWNAVFGTYHPFLEMGKPKTINVKIINLNKTELIESAAKIHVVSDSNVVDVTSQISLDEIKENTWNGSFSVSAIFIGRAKIFVEIRRKHYEPKIERSANNINLKAFRNAVLQSNYAEFYEYFEFVFYLILRLLCGIAINWRNLWSTLRQPIAPGISVICNFIVCPLVSKIYKVKT